MTTSPVVILKDVSQVFDVGNLNETAALRDINLEIGQGEFVSLIGPSGCGKSTVLRLIGDLIAPTSGTVMVNQKPAHQARLDQDYGIVFQSPVLFEWRRVIDNVRLPLQLRGFSRVEQDRRAAELLSMVELDGFERYYPWQLSGGMQQRAAIARALATRPSLLLMDEPFGALDELTRERLNMELHTIWQHTRTTVIFVTHSIPEAVFLSNRVVAMSARPGRITQVVDVDLTVPRTDATRGQTDFFELVNTVRQALNSADEATA